MAQVPDQYRHGNDILIRCDSVGATHAFLRHIRSLRERGLHTFFSVGSRSPSRSGPRSPRVWTGIPAVDGDRDLRDRAEIAEISHLADQSAPRARG